MGSLTIKVKILRCEKCFMLKKLFIEPNHPNSTVLSECSCGFSRTPILSFTNALKNPELYTIKCFFCKKEPKHPLYCIGCRRIYCNTCKHGHNTKIKSKVKHILIDAYKYDFYCAEHQDNLNSAYCLDCQIDICKICIEEKRHEKHIVLLYNKVEMNKKQVEIIKKNIEISKVKLTKKINMSKVLYDQFKDNNKKKYLRDVMNPCYKNNRAILYLVYYFYLMYTEIKEKNYIIIHNLTENIKFNHQPFLLVQTTSLDERLNDFIDFLKNDFVLFKRYVSTKLKKNNIIEVSKKQNENNNDKENIKENKINKTKPKTLFCLLKNSYDNNNNNNEKTARGNKIKINYQNNKEKTGEKNKIPKNIYNHLIKERMNKYNSFSSFLFIKQNIFHNNKNNSIMQRIKQNDSSENNNYQYSSNSYRNNLIHSPSNYSLLNNIKNKIFNNKEKIYQKSFKKAEKNKNSFCHYKKLNSFILNHNNLINNSLSAIRLSNKKNNNNNERTYKIYNIKGNNTSRMEINRNFNIKFTFNKTKSIKEGNNFNIRKKLYRNNSAEYIGYKELNKSILKKLKQSDSSKNIK